MTIASEELFELCKRVYEATGWDDTQNGYYNINGKEPLLYDKDNFDIHKEPWWGQMAYLSPAYTSDYLLEKLPRSVENNYKPTLTPVVQKDWRAAYDSDDGFVWRSEYSDTPLKALLKLTLKLHEEKIL